MTYRNILKPILCGGIIFALSACEQAPTEPRVDTKEASQIEGLEVSRTQYGVVHVKAANYHGLGYGFAYSHAEDNVCLLAEHVVTVNGERSLYYGIEGANAANQQSDLFYNYFMEEEVLDTAYGAMSQNALDMAAGYRDGYNAFLASHDTSTLPEACRSTEWVRPITLNDLFKIYEDKNIFASSIRFKDAMLAASPPAANTADNAVSESPVNLAALTENADNADGLGSNGWAFGKDVTANGRGHLVGNPHFPWAGNNRFYQLHLTIPGEYDVMGVTIPPLPAVAVGFNKDVAWTHTVSTGVRYTLFELKLEENDPLSYWVDDKKHTLTTTEVSTQVKLADGTVETRSHVFYTSIFGPVIVHPRAGLTWSKHAAYAIGDVNKLNIDSLDTWISMGKARTVGELETAAGRVSGTPWVNTIAADRHGDALYADFSRVPNTSTQMLERCKASPDAAGLASAARIFVLNGADSSCNWTAAEHVPGGRFMDAKNQPSIIRADYVANSNDSYWLSNDSARFEAVSPVIGTVGTPQNLRTRHGIRELTGFLADVAKTGEKVTPANLHALQFRNSAHAAELVLGSMGPVCEGQPALTNLCDVLSNWDRKTNLESQGAALFREFWRTARRIPKLYAVAFDPADPVNTPRQLNTSETAVVEALRKALADARDTIEAAGFKIDTPLGDMQAYLDGDTRIPLHGGHGSSGVLNVLIPGRLTKAGYQPVHGASYIQIVTFNDTGPVAKGLLAYAQSVDPASPHYTDQMKVYSAKTLYQLPFTDAEIKADPGYKRTILPAKK